MLRFSFISFPLNIWLRNFTLFRSSVKYLSIQFSSWPNLPDNSPLSFTPLWSHVSLCSETCSIWTHFSLWLRYKLILPLSLINILPGPLPLACLFHVALISCYVFLFLALLPWFDGYFSSFCIWVGFAITLTSRMWWK